MLNYNQGFSLLQALIASLLLALGVMAIISTQLTSQKDTYANYQQTLAGLNALNLQTRLKAEHCLLNQYDAPTETQINNFLTKVLAGFKDDLASSLQGVNLSLGLDKEEDGYFTFIFTSQLSQPKNTSIKHKLVLKKLGESDNDC